jgi:hypothetical protein
LVVSDEVRTLCANQLVHSGAARIGYLNPAYSARFHAQGCFALIRPSPANACHDCVQQLLGVDFSDPRTRVALHLACHAVLGE